MTDISVHIVTYNNEKTIAACLNSLRKQSFKSYSLVIIDNNSSDNTSLIVKRYKATFYQNQENIGYAAAHNQGIKHTRSRFILTLNPDVVLHHYFLSEAIKYLKHNTKVGLISGKLLRLNSLTDNPSTVDSMGVYLKKNRGQGLMYEGEKITDVPSQTFPILGPDGAAAIYRRIMLEDIAVDGEIFDEDFFMHKEDIDVCWRARLRGWDSVCIPSAVAYHIRTFRPGKRRNIPQYMKTMAIRNRYFLIVKNDTLPEYTKDIPYIFLYELGILLYILIREQKSLRAYIEVIKKWNIMTTKRRFIQKHRKINPEQIRQWFT